MGRDDPRDPRYRGRPQGEGDSHGQGRHDRRDRSGADLRTDDDGRYDAHGAPPAPRSRAETRDLNRRPASPSRALSDSRDDDYSRNSRPRGSDPRNGHDDSRRGYDESLRGHDDSRRGYGQPGGADSYEAGRNRSRSSTRSFREDEQSGYADDRPRLSANSGPREERRGSGDRHGYDDRRSSGDRGGYENGRGNSRPGRGSSADDWGGGGRSSRGASGAGDAWGQAPEPLWPAEDEPTWATWGDKGPKANRGKGAVRASASKSSSGKGGIKGLWERFGSTRFRRAAIVFVLVSLLLCTFSSVLAGLAGATAGVPAIMQAYQGYTHLKNGETLLKSLTKGSLSATTMKQAQAEFATSQQDFTQAHANLARLPGFDYSAPIVGSKIPLALKLTALAATFSQIGAEACDAGSLVIGAVSNPFGAVGGGQASATATPGPTPVPTATPSTTFTPVTPAQGGLTPANLATIQGKLTTISALLNDSTAQINALNPSDFSFDAKLASEFGKLKAALPQIKQYLTLAMTILPVAGPLLGVGTPAKYFVELLDSTELRPGGGFIGNYGVMVVSGGTLSSLHVTDVDLLDRPFEKNGGPYGAPGCIQSPPQYSWFSSVVVQCWSLRDSNLDADFPTSAMNGETNYHLEGGKDNYQGVITITPWLIEKLIGITGPVTVPEFADPANDKIPVVVTSTNLPNMIHYFQLHPGHPPDTKVAVGTGTSQRKVFTADLFKAFMAQVKAKLKTDKTVLVKAALDALATKDLQVYFNNPQAEALLTKYGFDSTIQAPKTGDSLMVVDANIIANKANNFYTYTMDDQVSIDQYGTATHHLTLVYTWPSSAEYEKNAYGSHGALWQYQGYVRVYVPPDAQLLNTTGWWYYLGEHPAFGRQVYTGFIRMDYSSLNPIVPTPTYPNTVTVTLDYAVPNAATHKGKVWTYPFLIQHQAGHAPYALWKVTETVTPSCGKVTSVTAPWQISSGGKSATLKEDLSVDKSYTMTYTCAG